MKLIISENILRSYPDLRIGILIATGINNIGSDPNLQELKVRKAATFRQKYNPDTLIENPYISAWREIYRSFGVNPKESKPTVEALLRRILQGSEIPTISKAVDLYLIVETDYYLPIGGYDLSTIKSNIYLRHSSGGEPFLPLGSHVEEQTRPGEVIYVDNERVLTRKWNYRDCDMCKITPNSTSIGLFTEAPLISISTEHLNASLNQLKEYMAKYCGGIVSTFIADVRQNSSWDLLPI